MDFREGLRTRRSVRQYIPNRDIPANDIRDILETAMLAPSGRNKQPWEFIVVNDKSKFPEITQAQPYCRFFGRSVTGGYCLRQHGRGDGSRRLDG